MLGSHVGQTRSTKELMSSEVSLNKWGAEDGRQILQVFCLSGESFEEGATQSPAWLSLSCLLICYYPSCRAAFPPALPSPLSHWSFLRSPPNKPLTLRFLSQSLHVGDPILRQVSSVVAVGLQRSLPYGKPWNGWNSASCIFDLQREKPRSMREMWWETFKENKPCLLWLSFSPKL